MSARSLLRRLRAPGPDAPLVFACLVLIVFGVVLRAQRLHFPRGFSWDEHHFVLNARNYLAGLPDLNDHPPLGKLLLALPMHLLGDNSVAWRLAPFLLGSLSIVLAGLLASWATGRKTSFWIGAAFVAADGFLIAYSRTALLDGMLACLCLGAVLVAVRSRSAPGVAAAALLLGSACAVKYSAVVFVPVLVWAALSKRSPLLSSLAVLLAPAAYVGWFSLGLWMAKRPFGLSGVVSETKRLYLHHAGLTHWKHPLLSHWYEWYLPMRPLPMRNDPMSDGRTRIMTSLGNPLLWWLVDVAVVFAALSLLVAGLLALRRHGLRAAVSRVRGISGAGSRRLLLLVCWCAPIAPWLISNRDSYMNHYLPAYAFGLVLVATLFDEVRSRFRTAGLVALLIVGQVSFFYAPVWGQLPLSRAGVEARLFLTRWR